jgi:hypothetical protein
LKTLKLKQTNQICKQLFPQQGKRNMSAQTPDCGTDGAVPLFFMGRPGGASPSATAACNRIAKKTSS